MSLGRRGFALVVTLTLMVMLSLLALGLLTLSTYSLRTTGASQADAVARANARMAVLIAIGELQKHAGPDKRITTNGTFDSSAGPGAYGQEASAVENPWLTGIWQREDITLDPNESGYESHPVAQSKTAWIVSGNETTVFPKTTPTTPIPAPSGTNPTSVWMLRNHLEKSGLSPADTDLLSVKVPLVNVTDGAYGYWVSDESQKATATLRHHVAADFTNHANPPSDIELARLGITADTFGIRSMDGLGSIAEPASEAWKKVFTMGGAELTTPSGTSGTVREALAKNFHSLAAVSNSVQADAKLGGLKRDLTLAFEMADADFNQDRFFTRAGQQTGSNSDDTGADLTQFNFRNSSAGYTEPFTHEMMFYKDSDAEPLHFASATGSGGGFIRLPTWHAMRSFYRTYKSVTTPDAVPALVASATNMIAPPNRAAQTASNHVGYSSWSHDNDTFSTRYKYLPGQRGGRVLINPTSVGFRPVVARLQIGYSFISGSGSDGNVVPRTSKIKLVADPIVTLWNPYNVRLNVTGFNLNASLPDMMVVTEKQETHKSNREYFPGDQCVYNGMVYEAQVTTTSVPSPPPGDWVQRPDQDGWILASNARVENISGNYGGGRMNITFANGDPFSMEAGELVVFSPNKITPTDFSGSSGWEFDMERGWNEEGGIAFDRLRVNTQSRTQSGQGHPDKAIWEATPFGNDSRSRVWVDPDANVRMTIEPYRAWGNDYVLDDPFGFVARYPQGGFSNASGKGGYPATSTILGRSDSLTGGNEGMPYNESIKLPGSSGNANTRDGSGITAHYGSKMLGVHNGPNGAGAPNPGMSDVFAVSDLGPTRKRWLGSLDWYLRNEADVDSFPVVIGNSNPRFEFNNHGVRDQFKLYKRASVEPMNLIFRRETSANNMTNLDSSGRGFWGPSHAASGESFVPMFEAPAAPLVSLGQFQHFQASPLNFDPAYIIANADRTPYNARNKSTNVHNTTFVDRSWYTNEVLFDSFFLSTLRQDDLVSVIDGGKPLRNPRVRFFTSAGETGTQVKDRLLDVANLPHEKVAANVMIQGGFNVNSTSVEAWKAFLAGVHGIDIAVAQPGQSVSLNTTQNVPVLRASTPNGDKNDLWRGYRELDDAQLQRLAEEIVLQVRRRGPFLSVSDFVNRRLEDDETGDGGALQIAIRDAGLNDAFSAEVTNSTFTRVQSELNSSNNYPFPAQATGKIAKGAPGFIQQGDLLQTIAPALTVRGDTFLIRGYGESRTKSGEVNARAWCEVTVQRTPAYVDPAADLPWAAPDSLNSPANRLLGRSFQIISFRWLNQNEV